MNEKHNLANEIFNILDQRWTSSSDIEKIPNSIHINDEELQTKIFVLNQVMDLFRSIPDNYYREDSHRQNIIDSVQDVLDELIDLEESDLDDYEESELDDEIDFDF